MSSADFIQIAHGGGAGRSERLFRAAVSAFCSLARPSRNDIAQLDDLAMPLFEAVSIEGRRFAAAALSECETAPPGLLRRLCNETIDIAAPLLMRSASLSDIELLGLIGRHGIGHARAIVRRRHLNPAIANIVRALVARSEIEQERSATQVQDAEEGRPADRVRRQLRDMMQPTPARRARHSAAWKQEADAYGKLRAAALTGVGHIVQTALADAFEIDRAQAGRIANAASCSTLMTGLRALDLSSEQAFVVTAAIFPRSFGHAEAVRLFLERYENLDVEAARRSVRGWRADAVAAGFGRDVLLAENGNRSRDGRTRHA